MTVVQGQYENTVTVVEVEEVQMVSQSNIELEFTVPGCNFDEHGTKYKTPPLPQQYALQLMGIHRADAHDLGEAEVDNDCDVQVEAEDETVCSSSQHKEPRTCKSMKRIGPVLRGLADTVQTRVGMMMTLTLLIAVIMMQNMWTMGNSHTGGLDNILRFDNPNIAGGMELKPEKVKTMPGSL